MSYDKELLGLFGVPEAVLPEIRESGGSFGLTDRRVTGKEIPITGILGDQQAALFGQGGWQEGTVKNTYGTGLFMMTATGGRLPDPGPLVGTVAWKIDGKVCYALEGSVFVGGSCIQWLRDGLGIIKAARETERMARSLASNEEVYFVPALTGLGAPYWDPDARGTILGITRGTRREHLARAALEGIAYQVRDVYEVMRSAAGTRFRTLFADGGASQNDFLLQFQSDILAIPVQRPRCIETTAFGAAGIAGIAAGFWSRDGFLRRRKVDRTFRPAMPVRTADRYYARWRAAVGRALVWAREP